MADAVLVIDMLNDFLYGKLRCERGERIIAPLKELLANARAAGVPVVYSGDAHLPNDFELRVWGEHAMLGTEGAQVIPELAPQPGDYQVDKRTYSAFFETGLDSLLRSLGVDRVLITGLHTNICDRHTTADAFFRGYQPVIVSDCVEAFDEQAHRDGLDYLKTVYGAEIRPSAEIAATWAARTPAATR